MSSTPTPTRTRWISGPMTKTSLAIGPPSTLPNPTRGAPSAVLFERCVELVVLDADRPAHGAPRVGVGKVEGGPIAKLVFVIGPEIHLVRVGVGVELIELFVVVALAVHKGDKDSSRLGTENLSKELCFQIRLYFVSRRILAVFQ